MMAAFNFCIITCKKRTFCQSSLKAELKNFTSAYGYRRSRWMLAARTVRIVLTYLAQLFYATHRDTNGTPQSVVGPEGLGTADKG